MLLTTAIQHLPRAQFAYAVSVSDSGDTLYDTAALVVADLAGHVEHRISATEGSTEWGYPLVALLRAVGNGEWWLALRVRNGVAAASQTLTLRYPAADYSGTPQVLNWRGAEVSGTVATVAGVETAEWDLQSGGLTHAVGDGVYGIRIPATLAAVLSNISIKLQTPARLAWVTYSQVLGLIHPKLPCSGGYAPPIKLQKDIHGGRRARILRHQNRLEVRINAADAEGRHIETLAALDQLTAFAAWPGGVDPSVFAAIPWQAPLAVYNMQVLRSGGTRGTQKLDTGVARINTRFAETDRYIATTPLAAAWASFPAEVQAPP